MISKAHRFISHDGKHSYKILSTHDYYLNESSTENLVGNTNITHPILFNINKQLKEASLLSAHATTTQIKKLELRILQTMNRLAELIFLRIKVENRT